MPPVDVPFYRPYLTGRELPNVADAIESRRWCGNGPYTERCRARLLAMTGKPCYLTPSATAGLEIAALALGAEPGGEVIVPSYTFASTATCLVQAGLVPVLVDVRADTVNLDERLVEQAITPRTRAIFVVHYAGVSAEMDALLAIARRHWLAVVEDAAQGVNASYRGRPLGAIGDLGVFSFHETKNFACGEGGAVIVGNPRYAGAVEVHHEVGTDRGRWLRGEIEQYGWVDRGSNYLMSDLLAAFLLPQLEAVDDITARRRPLYERYVAALKPLAAAGVLRLPVIPPECQSNYHFFHMLVDSARTRDRLRAHLRAQGIGSATHYIPLHLSPGAQRFGRVSGPMDAATMVGDCLVRLPLYTEMTAAEQDRVLAAVLAFYG
jgi:dTDP-4-amino-4,6-dideoxygalactose transaminase